MDNWADTDGARAKPGHGGWYTPEGVTGTGWLSTEKRLRDSGFDGQKGSMHSAFPKQGEPQASYLGSQSMSPDKDDPTPNMKSFGNNRIID